MWRRFSSTWITALIRCAIYERTGKYGRTSPLRDIAYRRNYEATRHLLRHLGWEVDIFWASIMGDLDRASARITG